MFILAKYHDMYCGSIIKFAPHAIQYGGVGVNRLHDTEQSQRVVNVPGNSSP